MIMWDFFPVANVEIGAVRSGGSRVLFAMEQAVLRSCDAFVLMSPRGVSFLYRYYAGLTGRHAIIPPWGADDAPRASVPPKRERFTVVWGGQIVKGRAIDDLLRVAAIPAVAEAGIEFVIAGDGPARSDYAESAVRSGLRNVHFLGSLPREEYVELLRTCHIGASLMSEMSVPSFPSKVVDYCRVGLPVLAAVESGTDFGEIITDAGFGVAAPAGDFVELAARLVDLASSDAGSRLESMRDASRRFFEERLDVKVAADRFEELVFERDDHVAPDSGRL